MKMKKTVIALGAALILGLTGCGGQTQINVEQAGMLASAATGSDKFAGMVVSENVVEIERDTEKQIEELYVAAGDVVRVNEKLFEYDTDTLSLTIDKQQLELDKLTQQIKDLTTQKTNLEKQIKELDTKIKKEKDKKVKAEYENQRSTLDLQLRTVKADQTESTLKKNTLQAEMNYNKDMLKNAVVRSPIKGTIRAINESGTPYITIQQAGAFQVKGMLNELSLGSGIMEGVSVTILSRTDPTASWTGMVSLVDYNNVGSEEQDNMFGGGDAMSTSTSYPFYITLDSTEGLLLGQHVYIQISASAVGDDLLRIPEHYVMDVLMDEETWLTTGTVWGVDPETNKLVKVPVTLGEYDPTYGTYVILEGITAESYLANPTDPGVKEGAEVYLRDELEYMGQTEPTESQPIEGETAPSDPVAEEQMGEAAGDDIIHLDSLVIPTEDPDKIGD